MRKMFFLLVAVLWVVAGFQLLRDLNPEEESQIVQAFNKTNCMDAVSKIQVHVPLSGEYKPIGQQRDLLINIAQTLGISGNYEIDEKKDGEQTCVQLWKEASQASTFMKIVTIESDVLDSVVESAQYLMIEIKLYDKLECAVIYKEKLEHVLWEYEIAGDINLQFSGTLPGKIGVKEREVIAKKLLEDISAKVCSKHEEDGLYTVYAYTDVISEYRTIDDSKVNVTVAVNYNEESNETGLYLATPFLNEDY